MCAPSRWKIYEGWVLSIVISGLWFYIYKGRTDDTSMNEVALEITQITVSFIGQDLFFKHHLMLTESGKVWV